MWPNSYKEENGESWHNQLAELPENGLRIDRGSTKNDLQTTTASTTTPRKPMCENKRFGTPQAKKNCSSNTHSNFRSQSWLMMKPNYNERACIVAQEDDPKVTTRKLKGGRSWSKSKAYSDRKLGKRTPDSKEDSKLDDLIYTLKKVREWIRDRGDKRRGEKKTKTKQPLRAATSFKRKDIKCPFEDRRMSDQPASITSQVATIPDHTIYPEAMEVDPLPLATYQTDIYYDEEMADLQEDIMPEFSRHDNRRWSTISYYGHVHL